jgi:hypothetical protein
MQKQEMIMKKLILAVAMIGAVASPAFAQSYSGGYSTGNELPYQAQSTHAERDSSLNARAEARDVSTQAVQAAPDADNSCFASPASMNFTSCRGD